MNAASDFSVSSARMLQPPPCDNPPCERPEGAPEGGMPQDGGMMGGGGGGTGGGGGEEPLSTAAGIMLTGGYMFNALAAGNLDAVEGEIETLDVCLCHPSPFGDFHYHYWGSCMKRDKGYFSDSVAPPGCKATEDCMTATSSFMTTKATNGQDPTYTAENYHDVIGLAKDGHMIIGPYKSDGTQWGCDRDVCNGNFVDGSYVYVGSSNFPYIVGCWGPGPDTLFAPTCSTNGCGAGDGASSVSTDTTGGTSQSGSITSNSDQARESNDYALTRLAASIGLFTAAISTLCF